MDEPYRINEQEFESVTGLGAPNRYEHFLKRICDTVFETTYSPTTTSGTAAGRSRPVCN